MILYTIRPFILTATATLKFEVLGWDEETKKTLNFGTTDSYELAKKVIKSHEIVEAIQEEYSFIYDEESITIQ